MIPLWLFYRLHCLCNSKKAKLLKEDISKYDNRNNFFVLLTKNTTDAFFTIVFIHLDSYCIF